MFLHTVFGQTCLGVFGIVVHSPVRAIHMGKNDGDAGVDHIKFVK